MKLWKDIVISALMGLVLPGIVLNIGVILLEERPVFLEKTEETEGKNGDLEVNVRQSDQTVRVMEMDAYLEGVILAEMPVWFEKEALKAQAVVARTYARKAWETGGKHGDGSVCMEAACCQGYNAPAEYDGSEEELEKIAGAVRETSGKVLVYEGELIEATYFSCSGGYTEDAAAVWGQDFPYLQAVESPGEEDAAYYRDTAVFSRSELEEKLGILLAGEPGVWVGEVDYTEGGSVANMVVGGASYTGVMLRKLLGLRSAAFTVEPGEDSLIFITKGYGHRVGMSQYGADAMAVSGKGYEEILSHYYRGAALVRLEG